ncbi:MAG TPA: flagellar biosynthetic protein FliO [Bryobacteraceae bacterium]|nr:flagellar biosynthetic protein FliO [Bryobacteraceae bacterium]
MEVIGQVGAVAAVLGLLILSLWWLRNRGFATVKLTGRSSGRRMESIERLALGPQHALHLIRIGGKALLVSSSPAGCALVERLAWTEIERPNEGIR